MEISFALSFLISLILTIATIQKINSILNSNFSLMLPKVVLILINDSRFIRFISILAPIFIIIFPATFCTIDILSENFISIDFWEEDLKNNLLQLRIITYILTYNITKEVVDIISNWNNSNIPNMRKIISIFSYMFQFGFFLTIVTFLWVCSQFNIHSNITIFASWALFFIVDDWTIITEYMKHFESQALPYHINKLLFFDFLLLITTMVTSIQNPTILIIPIISFSSLIILICACAFMPNLKETS